MRNRFVLALLLAATAAPALAADAAKLDAESRIERVTVYEDRALVTRGGRIALEAGVTEVRFRGLPTSMDQDTLVARTGGALVLGVDIETVHLAEATSDAVKRAQTELDAANRVVRLIELDQEGVDERYSFLSSIRVASGEKASAKLAEGGTLDVEALGKVLEFLGAEGAKVREAGLENEKRIRGATAERDAAKRRLDQLRSQSRRTELQVVVTLESEAGGEIPLALQYLVHGAAWRPSYDLRVTGDFQGASLGLTAFVTQQTGEDWEGVEMLLTTAQPAAGTAPPPVNPWHIGLLRPEADEDAVAFGAVAKPAASKAAPREAARKKGRHDSKDAFMDQPPAMDARVRRSGVVVAFEARLPETVRSDGQPARVALARFDMDPDVWWVAHPELSKKVFVTAKVKNSTGTPLPGGRAKVFLGPDFVGRLQLADWGIGKEIDLGLGVDREVEVVRLELERKRSTEGIFSKEVVHTRRYRITVHNHRQRPARMRIVDRIPVSSDEDVEVELTEMSHELATLPEKQTELNKARGYLQWHERAIAAGRLDIEFGFTVRHPKDSPIVGMDR